MDRIDRRYEGRVTATLTGDRTVIHLIDGQLDYGTLEFTVDRAGIRVVYIDADTYDAIEGDPATDRTFDADLARWPAATRSLLHDDRYAAVLQAGPPHAHGLHLSAVRVDARAAAAAPAGGERQLDPTSLRRLWGPLVEWYRTTGGGHVTVTKGPWRCVQFTGDRADGHVALEVVVRHGEPQPSWLRASARRPASHRSVAPSRRVRQACSRGLG